MLALLASLTILAQDPDLGEAPTSEIELGPDGHVFIVKNHSDVTLACRGRAPGKNWTRFVSKKAGREWVFNTPATEFRVHCRPPVRQVSFRLRLGENYGLQRRPKGGATITLIRITPD